MGAWWLPIVARPGPYPFGEELPKGAGRVGRRAERLHDRDKRRRATTGRWLPVLQKRSYQCFTFARGGLDLVEDVTRVALDAHRGHEQVRLSAEEVMNEGGINPGPAGDAAQTGPFVALLGEARGGRLDNVGSGVRLAGPASYLAAHPVARRNRKKA